MKSYSDILKPLVDGISEIPNKYTNVVKGPTFLSPNIKDHSEEQSFEEEEFEVSWFSFFFEYKINSNIMETTCQLRISKGHYLQFILFTSIYDDYTKSTFSTSFVCEITNQIDLQLKHLRYYKIKPSLKTECIIKEWTNKMDLYFLPH